MYCKNVHLDWHSEAVFFFFNFLVVACTHFKVMSVVLSFCCHFVVLHVATCSCIWTNCCVYFATECWLCFSSWRLSCGWQSVQIWLCLWWVPHTPTHTHTQTCSVSFSRGTSIASISTQINKLESAPIFHVHVQVSGDICFGPDALIRNFTAALPANGGEQAFLCTNLQISQYISVTKYWASAPPLI